MTGRALEFVRPGKAASYRWERYEIFSSLIVSYAICA